MNKQKTYAVDFETFYSKVCSIRTLGPQGYFSHPDFDAYMISAVGSDGYEFCGHPKDFDWSLLEGNVVLSHNASFDQSLYKYGVQEGWYPDVNYDQWHCTADLAAYLGLPRNLAGASEAALGIKPDKSTRGNMLGKRWEAMTPEFQAEVTEYALVDSRLCLRLWQELSPKWPLRERAVSRVNREALQNGIPIDQELLQENLAAVKQYLFEAESAIPWLGEKKTLSRPAFNEECRKVGIDPPASLAKDNPEAVAWIKEHGQKYKWIKSVGEWRRINSLMKKLEAIDNGVMPDGRYYGNIMYWGAHTGRFSGGGGNFNLQNIPKEEMFGVRMRPLVKAPKGKKLIVVDLSQIEVRTLMWWAKDEATLQAIRESDDIYEAFAITFGLWSKEQGSLKDNDYDLRQVVKAIVLGCGFGAGDTAFAAKYGYSQEEAAKSVGLYRRTMKKVVALWKTLKQDMQGSRTAGQPFSISMPSGRSMNYGHVKHIKQTVAGRARFVDLAFIIKHSKRTPVRLWHGLLAENISQALARDIFGDMLVRIAEAGHKILFHVHDELTVEVDESTAQEELESILNIMSTPPDWIPDIPVIAEGEITDYYNK